MYAELMMDVWRDGNAFCVIEQDIEIDEGVLPRFEDCGCGYAAVPYDWTTNTAPALGCTYFGDALLAAVPVPNLAGIHYRQVDIALMRVHLGQRHQRQPHLHLPPVRHLNPEQQLRSEFQHLSLADHLAALGYEISEDGTTAEYAHATAEFGEIGVRA